MILKINDSGSILFFVFLMVPMLLASKSYIYGRGGYAFLNPPNVQAIQGVAIVFILLQSMINEISHADVVLRAIAQIGNVAIALFLFLIGYQLMRLSLRNRHKLRRMMLKKMMALILGLWFGNLLFGLVQIYLGEPISLLDILSATLKFEWVGGTTVPFLGTLLYFYLVFMMDYKLRFLLIASVLLMGICYVEHWPLLLPLYVLGGAVLAMYPKYAFLILRKHFINLMLIVGILVVMSLVLKTSYLIPWLGILGMMLLLMKVQFKAPFFVLMNRLAIPLYVIHLPILYVVFYSSVPRNSFFVLVSLSISFLLVILWHVVYHNSNRS